MALTLSQGVALVADQSLQYRVAMAFYYVARQVATEPEGTVGHEQRLRFAYSIIPQGHELFMRYTPLVVTDPAIVAAGPATQSAITDGQIINAVTAMWNTLAGVPDA